MAQTATLAQTMTPSTATKELAPAIIDEEELMRSYVKKGKFKIPDPYYAIDERAYLEYEDRRRGTFLVIVASEGKWCPEKQDIVYQLKLGDGSWYKNGDWIGEKRLK